MDILDPGSDPVPEGLAPGIILARGVCRGLAALGYATLTEMPLANGRRADVVALDPLGNLLIVEVKSSIEDFRTDRKWPEYRAFCDALYFAVPSHFPQDLIPDDCGLMVTDAYHAVILRATTFIPLAAARRKAMMIRFGRLAAHRLQRALDPGLPELNWSL